MSFNQNSGYGRAFLDKVQSILPIFGNIMVVKNSSDTADYNYQKLQDIFTPDNQGATNSVRFYTDLATAVAATQDGNNDVILLDSHTSHKVTSMLTISNSKVHIVGMDWGGRKIGSRSLISNTWAGAATDVAMVYITGRGCTYRNISFKNNWTVAQNLFSVKDFSDNSYFENCDIENLGSAHLTNNAAASLNLAAGEGIYKNCTLGQDTLLTTSTGGQEVLVTTNGTTKCTRCRFEDCRFQSWTSDTTHAHLRAAAGSIDRDLMLRNCEFVNERYATGAVAQDVAVVGTAAFGWTINLYNPAIFWPAKISVSTGVFTISPVVAVSTTTVSAQTS